MHGLKWLQHSDQKLKDWCNEIDLFTADYISALLSFWIWLTSSAFIYYMVYIVLLLRGLLDLRKSCLICSAVPSWVFFLRLTGNLDLEINGCRDLCPLLNFLLSLVSSCLTSSLFFCKGSKYRRKNRHPLEYDWDSLYALQDPAG